MCNVLCFNALHIFFGGWYIVGSALRIKLLTDGCEVCNVIFVIIPRGTNELKRFSFPEVVSLS